MAKTREDRRQFWRSHVHAWRRSGQRRADYCTAHSLNPHTFNTWVGRLRDELRPGGAPTHQTAAAEPATFVPVEVAAESEPPGEASPSMSDAPIEVDAGGVTLRVAAGADTAVLARVITAARRAA